MGKTSLAVRAAYDCPPGLFQRIVFVSVKDREMDDDGERPLGNLLVPGFLEMLIELARELGQPDIAKSPEDQRIRLRLRGTHPRKTRPGRRARHPRRPRPAQSAARPHQRNRAHRPLHPDRRQAADRALGGWSGLVAGDATPSHALAFLRTCPPDNDPLEFIFGDLAKEFTADEEKVLCALTYFSLPAKVEHVANVADFDEKLVRLGSRCNCSPRTRSSRLPSRSGNMIAKRRSLQPEL